MTKRADLKGQIFGGLEVIEFVGINKGRHAVWRCLCGCGREKTTTAGNLRNGSATSCGCRQRAAAIKTLENIRRSRNRKKIPRACLRPNNGYTVDDDLDDLDHLT